MSNFRVTNLDEYQSRAVMTALSSAMDLNYLAPGLAAEAGEVAGKWAKAVRDNEGILTNEKREELLKEVGDTLWFLALICELLSDDLSNVASNNIDKLFDRQKRGVLGGSGDNR